MNPPLEAVAAVACTEVPVNTPDVGGPEPAKLSRKEKKRVNSLTAATLESRSLTNAVTAPTQHQSPVSAHVSSPPTRNAKTKHNSQSPIAAEAPVIAKSELDSKDSAEITGLINVTQHATLESRSLTNAVTAPTQHQSPVSAHVSSPPTRNAKTKHNSQSPIAAEAPVIAKSELDSKEVPIGKQSRSQIQRQKVQLEKEKNAAAAALCTCEDERAAIQTEEAFKRAYAVKHRLPLPKAVVMVERTIMTFDDGVTLCSSCSLCGKFVTRPRITNRRWDRAPNTSVDRHWDRLPNTISSSAQYSEEDVDASSNSESSKDYTFEREEW